MDSIKEPSFTHSNYNNSSYITIFLCPFRSLDQCATGVSQPTEQCSEQTTKYTDFERRKLKLFPVLSRYLFVVGKGSVTFHEAKKQQTTTVVYRSDFSTKLIDSLGDHPFKTSAFFRGEGSKICQIRRRIVVKNYRR